MTLVFSMLYRTTSRGLAAYLLCVGFDVKDIQDIHTERKVFVFDDDRTVKDFADDYKKLRAKVEPSIYYEKLKFIRQLVYEKKRKL